MQHPYEYIAHKRACRLRRNTAVDGDCWHGQTIASISSPICEFFVLVSLRLFSWTNLVAAIPERTATGSQAPGPKDLSRMSGTGRGSVAAVTIAPPRSLTAQSDDEHCEKGFSMPYTPQCEGDGRLLQLDSPALLPVSWATLAACIRLSFSAALKPQAWQPSRLVIGQSAPTCLHPAPLPNSRVTHPMYQIARSLSLSLALSLSLSLSLPLSPSLPLSHSPPPSPRVSHTFSLA